MKLRILSAHEAKVGTYEDHEVTACIGNDGKPFVRIIAEAGVVDLDPETLVKLMHESMYAIGVLERHAGRG